MDSSSTISSDEEYDVERYQSEHSDQVRLRLSRRRGLSDSSRTSNGEIGETMEENCSSHDKDSAEELNDTNSHDTDVSHQENRFVSNASSDISQYSYREEQMEIENNLHELANNEETEESEDEYSEYQSSSDSSDEESVESVADDDLLYDNAPCSVTAFGCLLKVFAIKHAVSEKATDDLLKILCSILPMGNKCPSSVHKLKKMSTVFQHKTSHYKLCSSCYSEFVGNSCVNEDCNLHGNNRISSLNFFTFDLKCQLQRIVNNNYNEVLAYKNAANGSYVDVLDGSCYKAKIENLPYITIVWHIDGAPTIKSKTLDLWLITAFVVEVPISCRFALKNILFCGLWYGDKKPDFELFQLHFVREIKSLRDQGFTVLIEQTEVNFFLKIQASLADLPARAASMNIKQFNGKFGCPTCLHPGRRLNDSLVRVYPYQPTERRALLRNHREFSLHAEAADQNNTSFFGVKGKSVLLEIMSVPDETPFDYMHLALEGELKRKLTRHFFPPNGFLTRNDLREIDSILNEISFPHDFSKKITLFNEKVVKKGKAGELQLLLLHVLLPILKNRLPDDVYCHLGLFVTSMQLLNKDSVDEPQIKLAEDMLNEYHKRDVGIYGEESQTFTNHALTHMADQRRKHGCPIVLLSNFVFEGFIASLKRQYHGTRGIVMQMVSNMGLLQNIDSMTSMIDNDGIKDLAKRIVKKRLPSKIHVAGNTFLYGPTSNARPTFPDIDVPEFILDLFDEFTVYSERLYHKCNVYHSLSYRYKRNSNSFTISYGVGQEINYGIVLFYAHVNEHCYIVLRNLVKTGIKLFSHQMIGSLSEQVDNFIRHGNLGQGFIHVRETNSFSVTQSVFLRGRLILIPDENGGFVSEVLSSYQHD